MAKQSNAPKRRIIGETKSLREMASQAVTAEPPRRLRVARRRAGAPFRALDSVFRYLGKYKIFRIVGYVIVLPYFRNSWKELEGVTWTKWRESLRLTSAVFAFALVFGIVIAIVDYGLDKVFKQVLLK